MRKPDLKASEIRLSWFFVAMILLSILQGGFSVYNLRQTIGLQESARVEEQKAWRARQRLGDVHYSIYKLLGTMDPYKMDTFKVEYETSMESLIDECSQLDISVKKPLHLKSVYDSIVDLQYNFAVNLAKEQMNSNARQGYNELMLLLEQRSEQISNETDVHLSKAVASSILSIIVLQIFVVSAIVIMGRFYIKSLRDKQKADIEIKQAHRSLTDVLDSATQVSIIAFDSFGQITLFNKGAVEMLNVQELETVQKKNILHFIDPEEIVTLSTELEKILGYSVSGVDALTKRITPQHPFQGYMTLIDNN